ncbi:MAG: hypothetical protein U0527_12445 [Candidatus Eisenbacteria bacterium]
MARFARAMLATVLCLPLSTALAGPNAGGTLLLHADPSLVYTTGGPGYCALPSLTNCEDAVVSVAGSATHVIQVIAAFPEGSLPRLTGITFGVQYDEGVTIVEHGTCGDFLLPDPNWPATGTGAAITWSIPELTQLVPVYWFAAYNYGAPAAAHLELTPHPTQGGSFGDVRVPSILDPITGFGSLGFDAPGVLACPAPVTDIGACCLQHHLCTICSAEACAGLNGLYVGAESACEPNPCPPDPGACCFPDGSCLFVRPDECAAANGSFFGENSTCDPNPCPFPTGACCVPTGECLILTQLGCLTRQGIWLGTDASCNPYPCPPWVPGACCLPEGGCIAVYEHTCNNLGGTYRGHLTICDPGGTCPGPIGACCYHLSCDPRSLEQCLAANGVFAGEGTSCTPNPCEGIPRGACCFGPGYCEPLPPAYCADQGGQFLGDNTVCDPNPCEQPPIGACCMPDTRCLDRTIYTCTDLGGTWMGAGNLCASMPCPGNGACCMPQGICVAVGADLCAELGSFLGVGVPCEPSPCELPDGCQPYEGGVPRGWRLAERVVNGGNGDILNEPIGGGRSPRWSVVAPTRGVTGLDEPSSATPCGDLRMTTDGHYEWYYGWGYEGIAAPDYGAFAECYSGSGRVCAIALDLLAVDDINNNYIDLYVWEDAGGCPGNLICKKTNVYVNPGHYEFYRVVVPMPNCCVSGTWWAGFRANRAGEPANVHVGADLDGSLGCAVTKIAPGIGYPEGWHHVSWIFGPTQSLGIGAYISECDAVTGACCAPWGGCILASSATCEKQHGMYLGDDLPCDPDPCPHVGACCTEWYGDCYVTWEQNCQGDYFGDDTDCDPDPCPEFILGACCYPGGYCEFTDFRHCLDPKYGGHFLGVDTDCDPNPCIPPPEGACCMLDGECSILTASDCDAAGGQYVGDSTVCDPSPCAPVNVRRISWGRIKEQFRGGVLR